MKHSNQDLHTPEPKKQKREGSLLPTILENESLCLFLLTHQDNFQLSQSDSRRIQTEILRFLSLIRTAPLGQEPPDFAKFFESCCLPDFVPKFIHPRTHGIPKEEIVIMSDAVQKYEMLWSKRTPPEQVKSEKKRLKKEKMLSDLQEYVAEFQKMSQDDQIVVLRIRASPYCNLDLKLMKFWKFKEMSDDIIGKLINKHAPPHFLVGLNLAAHFLDEPSVQEFYKQQDDPKAISQHLVNDLINSLHPDNENRTFLQDLLNLLDKTENEFEGKIAEHLQKPPMIKFDYVKDAFGAFDPRIPNVIILNEKLFFKFQKYNEEEEVLTIAFYICFAILHEISHWKMAHFGKYGHEIISPSKFKGIEREKPDSGSAFERDLFGGCLQFYKNQIFFKPDGVNITQKNMYVNVFSFEKFFTKDFWQATQKDFILKGDANADSKRYKSYQNILETGNDHRVGPHGMMLKYYVK